MTFATINAIGGVITGAIAVHNAINRQWVVAGLSALVAVCALIQAYLWMP